MISDFVSYDKNTGDIVWIKSLSKRIKIGAIAGSPNRKGGYLKTKINGDFYFNHHLALILSGIEIKKGEFVDHINGNSLDNRLCNIRLVSAQENMRNKRVSKSSKTGITGVTIHSSGLYHAYITVSSKRINLKYTKDKWEAICLRMSANNKYGFHANHGR